MILLGDRMLIRQKKQVKNNMEIISSIDNLFKKKFNERPLLLRSPGRVNLIGEHTDYNMGYVLPAAIDKAIYFAIAPRSDMKCKVQSFDMNDEFEFSVNDLLFSEKGWPNYLMGVVEQFIKSGHNIKGFNCTFGGDIPIGAGMSSSAALEAGLAYALNLIFDLKLDKLELVKLSQKAENEFVGVKCGIMDQYINIFGASDNVLRIDCRSLEKEYYPFAFNNVSLVLFDTCVSHSLASSEYNRRREECSEGVKIIKKKHAGVNHLRDVSIDMLNEFKKGMDETIYKRCKYVVEENERLLNACRDLQNGDLKSFGQEMFKTHKGLSDEYEVSCNELDFLVETVKNYPYVYGSRMMGGGFGGCTVNIIEKKYIDQIQQDLFEKYKQQFNIDLKTYITSIGPGTDSIPSY